VNAHISWCERELNLIGMNDDEFINQMMRDNILELIKVFDQQGHSGFSAGYCIRILTKLLKYKPLSPLTGEDSEWIEVADKYYQNKRCSSVFKDEEGVYDIDAIVKRNQKGHTYMGPRKYITFPYTPPEKPEVIEFIDDEDI
jgi:hypothetical protein